MLSRQKILDTIRSNPRIPAPPQTVFRILELTRDPEADVPELAHVIAKDGGLTAMLLRQANSVLYGCATSTSSVSTACMRLGLKRVRSAVVNQHVVNGLSRARPPRFRADVYWQTAFATSVAAQDLCQQLRPKEAEDASTAGLLCDVGVGMLAYSFPTEYGQVLERWSKGGLGLHSAEQQVFGAAHPDIGADILTEWKLDPHVIEAVRKHHHDSLADFPAPNGPFARVVAAAVLVARVAMEGTDMDVIGQLFAHLDKLTDKADAVVSRLLDKLVVNIQETAKSLAVELGSTEGMQANFDELAEAMSTPEGAMSFRPMAKQQ